MEIYSYLETTWLTTSIIKEVRVESHSENMEALRSLILDDIIGVIRKNQEYGNITAADARRTHTGNRHYRGGAHEEDYEAGY